MLSYQTVSTNDYEALRFETIRQLEGAELRPFSDSVGIATIGIGFNLQVSSVRDPLLEAFGFNLSSASDSAYAAELADIFAQDWTGNSAGLRNAADAVMAERAADPSVPGANKRSSFAFISFDEMADFFDAEIIDQFEDVVDRWVEGVPLSLERAAYVSLAYNGIISGSSSSPNLNAAIDAGDRAEAWFEIRYNTNGGTSRSLGIAKRRYVESHIHSLYADVTPDADDVSELEALQIFRMFTKHENRILQEEGAFGDPAGAAPGDVAVISARTGADLGAVQGRGASFALAQDELVETYAVLDPQEAAQLASLSIPTALLDLSFDAVFVAPSVGASGEVAAHTVDRRGELSTNLIFGAIEADGGGADTLRGGVGDDYFVGGSGGDLINGDVGEDTVSYAASGGRVIVNLATGAGSAGDAAGDELIAIENLIGSDFGDELTGSGEDNILMGGVGADDLFARGGADILFGGAGDDGLFAAAGDDRLFGGDGADSLFGGDGDTGADSLFGEGGADELIAGPGVDLLDGGPGADKLDGGAGADQLFGGAGLDTLIGGDGDDLVDGGPDDDGLFGRAGADTLRGQGGNDLIVAKNGADEILGGDGDDTAYAGQGDAAADTLIGGSGDDSLFGFAGSDLIEGGEGADKAEGGEGADTVRGDGGADILFGREGADLIEGGTGDDELSGNQGADTLFGGDGDDSLFAQFGSDFADGGAGNDSLFGGLDQGNDTLVGGEGNDTLFGLGGADRFVFARGDDLDLISDFENGVDDIRLVGFGSDFDSVGELLAVSSAVGGGLVLDFGGGDRLTVRGLSQADLSADDFLFA
ncbi:MAG: calcium-binding protein [Pseudomonadota bacterium]